MRVRVKSGRKVFYGGELKTEGTEFTIEPVTTHDGKVLSVEQQFSQRNMERIQEVKSEPVAEEPVIEDDPPIYNKKAKTSSKRQ